MNRGVVIVRASPSPTSRSTLVAEAVAADLRRAGLEPTSFSLGDFDPVDVFYGRVEGPSIARFVGAVKSAGALVLATPVYKGAYSGALKAIVDLVPPDALVGRPALGIATARLAAHGPEVDHAYRALFAFFKARALDSLVVFDDELRVLPEGAAFSTESERRLRTAAHALAALVKEASPS